MSCLYKIKESFPSLTVTDRKIADYILMNQDAVIEKSAQELSLDSETSSAAWIRFAKKIGYKGLTAMKMDLAKENEFNQEDDLFNAVINEKDSIDSLVKKVRFLSERTLSETYQLLNTKLLAEAIQFILHADNIYLAGIGGSGIICTDLMHKLSRINKNVIYHEDMHVLLSRMAHCQSNDVLIAISYSGKTKTVNQAAQYMKNKNIPIIAITQFNIKTPLVKLATVPLYLPIEEKELRLGAIASRNASLILTDLLYYGVAKENLEKTKESLIQTRELIKMIG